MDGKGIRTLPTLALMAALPSAALARALARSRTKPPLASDMNGTLTL